MKHSVKVELPIVFRSLLEQKTINEDEISGTADGFCALTKSIADILSNHGITSVPKRNGEKLECRLFFDDWYLYAVADKTDYTYSLYKMREQEYDAKLGLKADGDVPGVTISFIAMDTEILMTCLKDPTDHNIRAVNREINRVVARRGQIHNKELKNYFARTESLGSYWIAKQYTEYIASLAVEGCLPVPEQYAIDIQSQGTTGRLPRFIEENNRLAGRTVCDHDCIWIQTPGRLSEHERLAILATHTGTVSPYSFAAEVQFHARFLVWWAKIPLPIVGKSVYASAIRADISIADAEFTGPTPYYRMNSSLVKRQMACHPEEK